MSTKDKTLKPRVVRQDDPKKDRPRAKTEAPPIVGVLQPAPVATSHHNLSGIGRRSHEQIDFILEQLRREWRIDDNGVLRLILSRIDLFEEFGIHANFAGFAADGVTPTFWVDADTGKLIAANGNVKVDEDGITVLATDTYNDESSYKFTSALGNIGGLYAILPDSPDQELLLWAKPITGRKSYARLLAEGGDLGVCELRSISKYGGLARVQLVNSTTKYMIAEIDYFAISEVSADPAYIDNYMQLYYLNTGVVKIRHKQGATETEIVLGSGGAGGVGDGWTAGTGTWSYTSADAPTFISSVPDADAALMNVGDRWKITQTTVKYFIVVAKGSPSGGFTPVTIYGGTDYTLANAAITSPYWSHVKSPLGFPTSPAKWTVTVSDNNDKKKASPTANTWYGGASAYTTGANISLSIPIGSWRVEYTGALWADSNASQTSVGVYIALSKSNNSEDDRDFRAFSLAQGASGTLGTGTSFQVSKLIELATKTTYYVLLSTPYSNVANLWLYGSTVKPTIIRLVCAYL